MEVTKLIVEYLVSGILAVLALLLLVSALFPIDIVNSAKPLDYGAITSIELIVLFSFVSVAYTLGMIFEGLGNFAFSRVLDRIKRERLSKYIQLNADLFANDPLLGQFVGSAPTEAQSESLSRVVGEMRYYVMAKGQSLYADTALQLSRLRLIRVTFLVGLLVCISLSIYLFRSYSNLLLCALLLSIGLSAASLAVVLSRLRRYCRCIEKAYKILVLSQTRTSELGQEQEEPEESSE